MPVLDSCRDVHRVAFLQTARRLAPFLIVADAGGDDENLAAARLGVVDVPVVTAARLERDTESGNLIQRQFVQITVADEVLGKARIEVADRNRRPVSRKLLRLGGTLDTGDYGRGLRIRHAVDFADGDVRRHLRFCFRTCGQGGDRRQFACPPIHVVTCEDVAEKMRLQIFVQLWMEVEETAFDGAAAKFRLVGGTEIDGFSLRRRIRGRANHGLLFSSDLHQRGGRVQGARTAAVGVELSDQFLCFIQRKAVVEAHVQGIGEGGLVAARRGGGLIDDGEFFCGKRVVHGEYSLKSQDDGDKCD